jgi:hypothetical protein
MAKLNAPKAFDIQELESKFGEDARPLVEHVNQNFDQVLRAIANQLTLTENFKGSVQTISAMNRETVSIAAPAEGVSSILPLYVTSGGVSSYSWTRTQNGTIQIMFEFSGAIPIKTRACDATSDPVVVFTVQEGTAAKLRPGDLVSVSGFSNKLNNSTFLVLETTSNSISVHSSVCTSETKAEFTGTSETSKSVTVFLFN